MGHGASAQTSTVYAVLAAAASLTAVLALAACSPSPPHPARTHAPSPAPSARTHSAAAAAEPAASTAETPSPGTSAPPTGASKGQLGSTLPVSDTSGARLDVTLTKVIDPASGANSYSKPASGKHFVGVKLRVQNNAPSTYQNNANNETTITLSNGKTLHANYNPIASCGNFDNGQLNVKSSATSTGCVTFQVPKGSKVIQVSYRNTVFPGTAAQWSVP
jgi:Domain of unknown function (DUF4352)